MRGSGLSPSRASDSRGTVRFTGLGAGSYRFSCNRADCWPVVAERALEADEKASLTVELRRLSELELTLRGREGAALAGATVALRSREFGVEASAWLQDGQIEAAGGLVTDAKGRLVVRGLPHGAYTWSVNGQAGGEFTLLPGRNELALQHAGD